MTNVRDLFLAPALRAGLRYSDIPACDVAHEWRAFGGALTFADQEAWAAGMELSAKVSELQWKFDAILDNIRADESLTIEQKVDRIEAATRDMRSRIRTQIRPELAGESSFRSFEGVGPDGEPQWYWAGIFATAYRDKHDTILSEDAHRAFVEACDRADAYPALEAWHVPGSEIGETLMLDVSDGLAFAFGTLPDEATATALRDYPEPLGMSLGFVHGPTEPDGTIRTYIAHELSVLPASRAGGHFTDFAPMEAAMTPTKKTFLERLVGADRASALEDIIDQKANAAAASGLARRDDGTEDVAAEPTAAAVAAAAAATAQLPTAAPTAAEPTAADRAASDSALAFAALRGMMEANFAAVRELVTDQRAELVATNQRLDQQALALQAITDTNAAIAADRADRAPRVTEGLFSGSGAAIASVRANSEGGRAKTAILEGLDEMAVLQGSARDSKDPLARYMGALPR